MNLELPWWSASENKWHVTCRGYNKTCFGWLPFANFLNIKYLISLKLLIVATRKAYNRKHAMAEVMTDKEPKGITILDLPVELRLTIYKYFLSPIKASLHLSDGPQVQQIHGK